MINDKSSLKEWLDYEKNKYDVRRGFIGFLYYLVGSEQEIIWGFQKRLRITEYYYNTHKRLRYIFSLVVLNHKKNKYGIRIGLNMCDKGLKIMHLGSILMNGNTKIGKDVAIHINTSFVAPGMNNLAPTVGNGVVIGVGATLIGGITIANYVAIGANSVVCKSVIEENIAVAGNPARKVSNNGNLAWMKAQGLM